MFVLVIPICLVFASDLRTVGLKWYNFDNRWLHNAWFLQLIDALWWVTGRWIKNGFGTSAFRLCLGLWKERRQYHLREKRLYQTNPRRHASYLSVKISSGTVFEYRVMHLTWWYWNQSQIRSYRWSWYCDNQIVPPQAYLNKDESISLAGERNMIFFYILNNSWQATWCKADKSTWWNESCFQKSALSFVCFHNFVSVKGAKWIMPREGNNVPPGFR